MCDIISLIFVGKKDVARLLNFIKASQLTYYGSSCDVMSVQSCRLISLLQLFKAAAFRRIAAADLKIKYDY